jgi:hypothetical protein
MTASGARDLAAVKEATIYSRLPLPVGSRRHVLVSWCPGGLGDVQRPPSGTTRADAGRRADGEAVRGLHTSGAPGTARSGAPVGAVSSSTANRQMSR